jgi:DNA gyrase subunit A
VAQIRETGRSAQGVTLISLDEGEKLAGLERIEERDVNGNGNGNGHGPESGNGSSGADGDIEPEPPTPAPTVH